MVCLSCCVLVFLLPSTARSIMVGWVFLVLTDACQFGHGVDGFTTSFIHSLCVGVLLCPLVSSVSR